jgi:hypothetical protein
MAQKVEGEAVEDIGLLDHHPVPAALKEHHPGAGHPLGQLAGAADRAELVVDPPQAQDRAAQGDRKSVV